MNDTPPTKDDYHDFHNSSIRADSEEQFSAELHRLAQSIEPDADFANRLMSDLEITRRSLETTSRKENTKMLVNTRPYSSLRSKFPVKADARGFMVFMAAVILVSVAGLFLLTHPPTSSSVNGSLALQASATPADPATQLDTFFAELTAQDAFSGTVLFARDQTVLLRAAYGLADREWNTPNTPATKFRIAEITESFTGAAILLLQEQGKLSVQDPICQYIENCPDAWKPITLHQLLTETSGIPDYETLSTYDTFKRQAATPNSIINLFRNQPLKFSPGSDYDNSISGYTLLGQVIEKVSGKPYASFLHDQFFAPLGLTDTGIENMYALVPDRARGYQSPTELASYIDMTTEYAAGQLYSTVDDLYKWTQALVSGKVISEKTFNAMLQAAFPLPTQDNPLPVTKNGYVLVLGEYQGQTMYVQAGSIAGFFSLNFYFPSDKTSLIILGNLASSDLARILHEPLAILYGSGG